MLRRFSKKNKNPSEGTSSSSSSDDARHQKKLLSKFLDFITSAIWSIPIAAFIERQSVVFDRQQMETDIYMEIHKEYSQLIDTLIECFCLDVGSTPAELVEAIRLFNQNDVPQKYKVALEPLLAAQNFNVFVPMMMRKNIELQLQALQMIEFMCGLIPSVLQLEDGETLKNMKKLTPEETERYVLISVLRHSKDEYEARHKSEEMEQMARNSRIQREALEQEIRKEEILLQKALDEGRAQNQAASTQTQGTSGLRSVAAIMAATFQIDTGTSTSADDVQFQLLDEAKKTSTSSGTMTSSIGVSSSTMTTSTGVDMGTDAADFGVGREGRPKSSKKVTSSVASETMASSSAAAGTMTSSTGVDMGTDAGEMKESRPKSAKRVGSSVGKRSSAKGGDDSEKAEDSDGQKTKEKRPGTSSKKNASLVNAESDGSDEKKKSPDGSPEDGVKEKPKRPGTAKGPNERKYSKAGLEDLVGPKNELEDSGKTEPKSRPSTRKTSRGTEDSSARPPSRKLTASHEPRAKTPSQKANNDDRPSTRRSSVDKNAPKRNDSVPRERRASVSQKDEKPPKPVGPLRSNKYDGDVVLGRPESPGMDHGPRRKNLNDVNSQLVDANRLNSSDVRTRAQYLREQRDKLLQMKNEERIKQMNDIQKSSLERPRTAARAREVLDKEKKEAVSIRKEISDKLKTQILTLH